MIVMFSLSLYTISDRTRVRGWSSGLVFDSRDISTFCSANLSGAI